MSNSPLNTRLLRSNCRSHGAGCSCPMQELPSTPRRSRSISVSRTPSRASSVAPELCLSSESTISTGQSNGISRHLDFQSQVNGNVSTAVSNKSSAYYHNHNQQASTHFEELITQKVQRNFRDDDTYSRSSQSRLYDEDSLSVHSRSSRYDDDDKMSQLRLRLQEFGGTPTASPSRSERERSYNNSNQRMVKMYNVAEGDETLTETDHNISSSTPGDRNGSMALSYSSSVGSNSSSAYESRSRILTTSSSKKTKTTTTISTVKNGNHLGIGLTLENNISDDAYSKSKRGSTSENYSHNSYVTTTSETHVSSYESRLTFILSHLRGALMFVPKLIYWSLVHLFVFEKWLLHRSGSVSAASVLKNVLPLFLFLLLGLCVFNSREYLPQYWERTAKLPAYNDVPPQVPKWNTPPALKPSYPDVHTQNVDYEKLTQKIALLERDAEENRRIAEESYSQKLNLLNKDWELKLHQEILKIEPATTTIVEKLVPNVEYDKLMERISILEHANEEYRKSAEDNYKQQLNILSKDLELKLHQEILKIEPTTTIVKQSETIIAPPAPPEPIDHDKLSSILMPLILPLIMDRVKTHVESFQKDCPHSATLKTSETVTVPSVPITAGFDMSGIEKVIRAAIAKYDADKTGLPDLALESAGGTILSTRCTKSSQSKNSVLTLWGWRVWSFSNSPRSIIQPGVVPGECWVVEGATAEVVIQLISPAVITGFTLEHIPKAVSPYGKIDTAPKKFQVMGLMSENDLESVWDYGTFEYLDSDEPIQYFPVQNHCDTAYPIVELRILSNHGSVKSTCIYRFRVHGVMIDMRN